MAKMYAYGCPNKTRQARPRPRFGALCFVRDPSWSWRVGFHSHTLIVIHITACHAIIQARGTILHPASHVKSALDEEMPWISCQLSLMSWFMIFWRQLTHFEIQKSFRLRRSLWLVVWPSPNFFRTLLRKRLTQRLLWSFSSNLASNFTLPVFLISYHVRMYMYDVRKCTI